MDQNLEDMATPEISVLMCVYNGEAYLRDAIDSVLLQTFVNFELLIIDDGSTDGSVDLVNSYSDPRIRLLRNETNLGLVHTRNKGFAEAHGRYIAILDCDDIANPERLAKQFAFMEANPDFGMIGSWVEILDADGIPTGEVMRYPAEPEEIPPLLLFGNTFAQSAAFIRKSSLPDEGYRFEFPVAEDYDLWVRMASVSKLWNIQEPLTRYRVHSPSMTFSKAELMVHCISRIIASQLASMDLAPSEKEVGLHRGIGNLSFPLSTGFLDDAESWLKVLCQANKNSGRYNLAVFEKIIGWRWYLVCRQSTGLGFCSWRSFQKSELRKLTNFTLWQQVKLLIRCAIKFQSKQ